MIGRPLAEYYLVFGAALGVMGLLSGVGWAQALGALTLLLTAGLYFAQRRGESEPPDRPGSSGTPELSLAERALPWIFLAATVLVVLALALYTLVLIRP